VAPNLGKADTASTSDDQSFGISKLLVDALVSAELVSLTLSRPLADSVWASDSASRSVSMLKPDSSLLSDIEFYSMSKLFGSTASTSDLALVVLEFQRQFSDQFASTDSGQIVAQGYCDLTYFAEDYIGSIRSF
jgi:hypothetical protein